VIMLSGFESSRDADICVSKNTDFQETSYDLNFFSFVLKQLFCATV